MAKQSTKLQKIGFRKYWFSLVFPRAIREIWEYMKRDLAMALLVIVIAIATSILSANGILDAAIANGYLSDASSLFRTFIALVVLSLLYLLFSVFYYPVKFHNEKEQEIDDLRKELEAPLPNIVPDPNGFDKLESAFSLWKGPVQSGDIVKRYFLSLQNIGKIDTTPIYATVSFYKMNCKEIDSLSHTKAFWFNDKPRVQRSGKEVHIIKALSNPEGVCLVMKKEGEKDLYVFSDDSYLSGTTGIVFKESLKIPNSKVYACVKLSAQNLPSNLTFWIKISNLKNYKHPKFEILDTPPC